MSVWTGGNFVVSAGCVVGDLLAEASGRVAGANKDVFDDCLMLRLSKWIILRNSRRSSWSL